jgi:hypothetical protein
MDRRDDPRPPRVASSGSKSFRPARSWRRETGKKLGRPEKPTPTPPNDEAVSSRGSHLRDPGILVDINRQAYLIRLHPENDEIDDWIEAVYDWDEFGSPFP